MYRARQREWHAWVKSDKETGNELLGEKEKEKGKEKSEETPERKKKTRGRSRSKLRFNLWGSKPEKKQQPESPKLNASGRKLGASSPGKGKLSKSASPALRQRHPQRSEVTESSPLGASKGGEKEDHTLDLPFLAELEGEAGRDLTDIIEET